MGFPKKSELEKTLKELETVDGTLALSPDATSLERFRWELQQEFVKYKLSNNINQKKLAEILEVDQAKVSKILHHRLDEFSTDRLVTLVEKIRPGIRLNVG